MIWKGRELKTTNDLMEFGIDCCESEKEAQEFILEYVKENKNARTNIGYLAGYYSREDRRRIFKWFDVVHPIFGTKEMDPVDLMNLGYEMGKKGMA